MDLMKSYFDYIKICIDEKGVFPHQCMAVNQKDELVLMALMVNSDSALFKIVEMIKSNDYKEIIWSLDRYCKEGQGTTLNDCLAGFHWKENNFISFIIEYQNEPRIVCEPNYQNPHWNAMLEREIKRMNLV